MVASMTAHPEGSTPNTDDVKQHRNRGSIRKEAGWKRGNARNREIAVNMRPPQLSGFRAEYEENSLRPCFYRIEVLMSRNYDREENHRIYKKLQRKEGRALEMARKFEQAPFAPS
jgi:hypothetical protein